MRLFAQATPPPADKLAFFEANGFVVFESAIAHDQIDAAMADIERHFRDNPQLKFSMARKIITNDERWRLDDPKQHPMRAIDLERHVETAPALFLHDQIVGFLKARLGGPPTCIQTLFFEKGSEQGPHSDRYLVSPPTVGENYNRDTLTAAWIAFEDANEENGGLVYFPGSHKLVKKRLGVDFDNDRDYMRYVEALCTDHGCRRETFHAKKGDVLFWHGDFVHGGGPIRDRSRSRRSLVAHYAKVSRFHRAPDHARMRRKFNGGYFFL